MRAPIKAFTVPGAVLLFLGIFLFLSSFPLFLNWGADAAVLGAVLVIVGVQIFTGGVFSKRLMIKRGLVDEGRLSRFFSKNFTAGRGFWIGVFLFGIGLFLALPASPLGTPLRQHVITFTLIAKSDGSMIITRDTDFGDVLRHPDHPGALILRLPYNYTAEEINNRLEKFLNRIDVNELKNSITILEIDRYRKRQI
ncbi:hypothetical protein AKJ39_05205 [candidate division MSBL1 archaeon SCGC-AAA259J03]|uniref:DUF5615 domain-containing protein n=1 Tax=candidate division MSBL1 archaeon SCGC-AAA259J03 TaxID=1698269 RepID=A0A656YUH5_9EURY|nr:hypothetical protein AKJ39_05205 [candidate division MSBL1 archaeon SCGC-AAA259J03]